MQSRCSRLNPFLGKSVFCGIIVFICLGYGRELLAQAPGGLFTIGPAGSPERQLEAVNSGTDEDTKVSIGVRSGGANQKWRLIPKGANSYVIRPSYSDTLALAADDGGTINGTSAVLETESGKPWQLWSIRQNANGTWSFLPKHAPGEGLDDFEGDTTAGAKQDIWKYRPEDVHLQWILTPLAGARMPIPDATGSQEGATVSSINVPAGVIKEFMFSDSAIFPGTKRAGVVFIPAQYHGTRPACVYVQQDGYNPEQKVLLERLIAEKEMPVTIGVFISPGILPATIPGMAGRRNRCFEYDSVNDNYVRFLTVELLPYVTKTFNLKLSSDGNDRCIAGASSGGIAAFNAAWQRPNAFSRVYACSGSFAGFRGGNEFPTLIRQFECKPIRAYLTTATDDMENCAGDWFLLDQEMDKALKFSGYDYEFRINEGHHCAGWDECFPEAMRFLWKDWPKPVQAGPSAPRVRDVIEAGENWEVASQGFGDARGPACNSKGEVFFIDAAANKIYRIGVDGNASVFLEDAAHANGLCIDGQDNIYTVSSRTGEVMRYDSTGSGGVYARGISGLYALAMRDGGLYVTGDNAPGEPGRIWWIKDGKRTVINSDIKLPTGLALCPDGWLLSVADGRSKWVYSYQIQPDGTLTNGERFFWLHVADWDDDAGAESVCYSREGQMFVATRSGIQVCSDVGPTQVTLPLPDRSRAMGVCLGGTGMNTLFAFCGDKVWKRTVKVHAYSPGSAPISVPATPL